MLCSLGGCAIDHALRLDTGQRLDLAQLVAELQDTSLVLLGEQHDNMAHHELQLAVIAGLQRSGRPLAIGLEMFEIGQQAALDAWVAGLTPEDAFIRSYQANWRNLDWGLYRDIFLLARDQHLPMIALNAPQQIVQTVARQGFQALSAADLRALPADAAAPLRADEGTAMVSSAAHGAPGHDARAAAHITQAQVLRNRVMAKGIERYLAQHPQSRMVVLTGALHAWRAGGIPSELTTLHAKVVLPALDGLALGRHASASADYLMD